MSTATEPTEAAFARAAAYSAYSMDVTKAQSGLTAREHAAIALRVPDSGNEWLDAMIRTAQRNDLAVKVAQGLRANPAYTASPSDLALHAYEDADAMLSAAATQRAEGE